MERFGVYRFGFNNRPAIVLRLSLAEENACALYLTAQEAIVEQEQCAIAVDATCELAGKAQDIRNELRIGGDLFEILIRNKLAIGKRSLSILERYSYVPKNEQTKRLRLSIITGFEPQRIHLLYNEELLRRAEPFLLHTQFRQDARETSPTRIDAERSGMAYTTAWRFSGRATRTGE